MQGDARRGHCRHARWRSPQATDRTQRSVATGSAGVQRSAAANCAGASRPGRRRGDVSSGVPTSPASVSLSSAIAHGVTRCAQIVYGTPTVPWCGGMGGRHNNGEAPPCMRWRGLTRPCSPACRSLGWPVTRLLSAADLTTSARTRLETPVTRPFLRSGIAPKAPGVAPEGPGFSPRIARGFPRIGLGVRW